MTYIGNFLRTKGLKWRVAYISSRFILDVLPSILVIIGLCLYDNQIELLDDLIYVSEIIILLSLCNLEIKYELPFLANQYGIRVGRIKTNVMGLGLEYLTEWRNGYILYLFIYKLIWFIRTFFDVFIYDAVFDYFLQYIIIMAFWIFRAGLSNLVSLTKFNVGNI